MAQVEERRKAVAREHGAEYGDMALSTLNIYAKEVTKAQSSMSRHPKGTRAKGLGQDYMGKTKVGDVRNRFGEAGEQSSRQRRARRAGVHSARAKFKKVLRALMENGRISDEPDSK